MKIKEYCRVCTGKNTELISIFEVYKFSECNLQIFEVITKCASVQIQKLDGCPEHICKRCTEHLCQAFSFKQLCEDSDYKFRHNLIDEYKSNANCDDVCKADEAIDDNIFNKELNSTPSIDDEFETKMEFCEEDTKIQFGIIPEENIKKPTTNFTRLQNLSGLLASLERSKSLLFSNENTHGSEFNINLEGNSEQTVIPCTEVKSEIEDENEARDISTFVRIDIKSEFNAEETNIQYGVLENQLHEKESSTDLNEELSGSSQNTEVSNQKPHISEEIQLNKQGEEYKTTFIDRGIIGPARDLYKCETCGKCFMNSGELVSHEKSHTGEKHYKCETCKKCFSEEGLLNHTREDLYKCGTCSKCFSRISHLNRHMKIHMSEKPYKCEICNKCFSEERSLNFHKGVHTGEKPHKCGTCSKSFSHPRSLEKHNNRFHKPYKCETCNKRFSEEGPFIYHKSLHTGEERLKCGTCSKGFNHPSDLRRHERIHISEKKPYKCEICNNCFSKEVDLNSHKRLVHLCFRDSYNLRIHKRKHAKK